MLHVTEKSRALYECIYQLSHCIYVHAVQALLEYKAFLSVSVFPFYFSFFQKAASQPLYGKVVLNAT